MLGGGVAAKSTTSSPSPPPPAGGTALTGCVAATTASNTNYGASDLTVVTVASADACRAACCALTTCAAFSWEGSATQVCHLKAKTGTTRSSAGYVSGTVSRPAPPPSPPPPSPPPPPPPPAYELFWSDEFDGAALDAAKWSYMHGDGCRPPDATQPVQYNICGWGNGELVWYNDAAVSAPVSGGALAITARVWTNPADASDTWSACVSRCTAAAACGTSATCITDCKVKVCNTARIECRAQAKDFCGGESTNCFIETSPRCENLAATSARIRTARKFAVVPMAEYPAVRISARVRLPTAGATNTGIWPAFWLLPDVATDCGSGCGAYGWWPNSGEIDVFESKNAMTSVTGSCHYGCNNPWNHQYVTATVAATSPTGWHTYAVEWTRDAATGVWTLRWFYDGAQYKSATSATWFSCGAGAVDASPFDQPFYVLLNVAVGGQFSGSPTREAVVADLGAAGPVAMEVDWVRVERKAAA